METIIGAALNAAREYGIMTPAITPFANPQAGEEGFFLELKGPNLNLTKSVHSTLQETAIANGSPLTTRTLPGRIQVYWKKSAKPQKQ